MAWYLQHYFDPDMDHLQLKPTEGSAEGADLYNLGYVQNVVAGQVLAQIVPLETVQDADSRFVLSQPRLPAGHNTKIDPGHPEYLLAACKGYVFYHEGAITVKKLLNVRGDISFATGNIFFVGDTAVHGNVRAGFEVQASNVLVKGMVEGGTVRAQNNLATVGGARGGAGHHCVLDAGGTLRSAFVEKLQVRARGNILIEKYSLHTDIYAGANVVVRDRLIGGTVHCYGSVLIGGQVGNMAAVPTRIFMGYDPLRIRQLEKGDLRISELSETITHLTAIAGHLPPDTNDASRKLAACVQNREALIVRRTELWTSLHADERTVSRCRLVVPGKIFPGVEVAIGRAFMTVTTEMRNVTFCLEDDDVVVKAGASAKQGA